MTTLLDAAGQARHDWVTAATVVLSADPRVMAVSLVGSLGRGAGDAFSDVDLIVSVATPVPASLRADPVTGLGLPGPVLFVRPKPRNAPAGGTYLAVCVELAGLPVLVDLYVWPATTAVIPAGGSVLFQRGDVARSSVGLVETLAEHPPDDPAGADPDDPATTLLLVQLAAKYWARADQPRYAGICQQLHLPADRSTDALRRLLDNQPPATPADAITAARRLLAVADEHRHTHHREPQR
ncbi:hypothetical protein ACFY36_51305 [Actinoplanes sp. NPDC000266]